MLFHLARELKIVVKGIAIFVAMGIMLVAALGSIAVSEQMATPQLEQNGIVDISNHDQAGGKYGR